MIGDTNVYPKNIITKKSIKVLYYMTESLNLRQPINVLN
jgi:hypothetical protein